RRERAPAARGGRARGRSRARAALPGGEDVTAAEDPGTLLRLRELPSVDEVLRDPRLGPVLERHARELVARAVRTAIARARDRILAGGNGGGAAGGAASGAAGDGLFAEIERAAAALARPALRRVVNATGVILHTGL